MYVCIWQKGVRLYIVCAENSNKSDTSILFFHYVFLNPGILLCVPVGCCIKDTVSPEWYMKHVTRHQQQISTCWRHCFTTPNYYALYIHHVHSVSRRPFDVYVCNHGKQRLGF